MLFDRPIYLVFLTLVVLLYWRLKHTNQNRMLVVASYFFYGWWDWRFLGLMLISTLVDYRLALLIESSDSAAKRRTAFIASLVMNFGFLGVFKYLGFFVDSTAVALDALGIHGVPRHVLQILLPPGISFYTFQAVAYIVDVYSGRLPATRSLVNYALFISLFPHLIAGPIQRPSHLLPQVENPRVWEPKFVFDGLMLIVVGLFRKTVIADNCGLVADAIFRNSLGPPNAILTVIGVTAFAWQIYGDFSAYSDIARGSAQLLGFHFMVNFRQPYLAESLRDFWRRWHISLSTWLRDYLYIPLGGSRNGERQTYRNLFLTMLLGGLWHGANWTFVLWGMLHGCGLAVERALSGGRDADTHASSVIARWAKRLAVFAFVCLSWIFFRAESVGKAFSLLGSLAVWRWDPIYLSAGLFVALFVTMGYLLDLRLERAGEEYPWQRQLSSGKTDNWKYTPYPRRIVLAAAMVVLTALISAPQSAAFIYFQF